MYLIVGLGNPGARYARNRHNIGFQVVDLVAARHHLSFARGQGNVQLAQGAIGTHKVLLVKPQGYMNTSGEGVRAVLNFYKIEREHLIVVYDDLDLPFGRLRLRPEGSAGGQNGVRSIIHTLGSDLFARLRIGIGRPPGRMDPAAYVLQDFSPEQEKEMAFVRPEAADALEVWLHEGMLAAMNRFNAARSDSND